MHNVIKQIRERERFIKETEETRRREREHHQIRVKSDRPPIFNKRLFAAKSHIVITREARRIMDRNKEVVLREEDFSMANYRLNTHEILHMKCIVEGLSLIHKDLQYVKECLAHVVTLEKYQAFQDIKMLPHEDRFSCYYILSGVVEVTYDSRVSNTFNVHETNIIYRHTTGEYLGLLAPESPDKDLDTPATMYTAEPCEFLRIDRKRFHETIEITLKRSSKEKMAYLDTTSVLRTLPENEKKKLIPTMVKQIYPAEKVIVRQNEISKFLFLIVSGRCQLLRSLYVPESEKNVVFQLGILDEGELFGAEGLMNESRSLHSVVAMGIVTCFRIKKIDFDSVAREPLLKLLRAYTKSTYIGDVAVKNYGYDKSVWEEYKRQEVITSLIKKPGGEQIISKIIPHDVNIKKRPRTSLSVYSNDGMEDFLKGFKPRPKSALYQPKKRNGRNVSRSKTSLGLRSKLSDVDGEEPDECLLIVGNRDPAEAAVGFLPTARMVFGRINTDMSRVEARDFINDWRRHQDMMKAQGHLDLSIDPNELVADKEASLALPFSSKYSDRDDSTTSSPRLQSTSGDTKDTWTSAIYEANETSKKHLFVVRFRLNYLKRQLRLRKALNMRLEKKRLQTQEYLTRKKLEVKAEESKRYEYDEEEHEEEKEWEDSDSGSDDSSLTELTVDVRKLWTSDGQIPNKDSSDSGIGSELSSPRTGHGNKQQIRMDTPKMAQQAASTTTNKAPLLCKRNLFLSEPRQDNFQRPVSDRGESIGGRSPTRSGRSVRRH